MITLIVEDEKLAAERLIELISKYDSRIVVKKVLDSVEKSVEWFKYVLYCKLWGLKNIK